MCRRSEIVESTVEELGFEGMKKTLFFFFFFSMQVRGKTGGVVPCDGHFGGCILKIAVQRCFDDSWTRNLAASQGLLSRQSSRRIKWPK